MDLFRREIKFQIPLQMVEPIRKYLDNYCEMDHHSKIQPDNFYIINSLYLDSDGMRLLENKRNDLAKRYSMRIRSYGESPKFPAFMEIKSKVNSFIHKKRAPLKCWSEVEQFRDLDLESSNVALSNPVMKFAYFEKIRLGLSPKIMTRYKRLAYFGLYDSYSRVTFDRSLACYGETDYNIFPTSKNFFNYDHQDQFESEEFSVVLELKCETKVPFWMNQMIRKFDLHQRQFSKFDSSWTYLTDNGSDYQRFNVV